MIPTGRWDYSIVSARVAPSGAAVTSRVGSSGRLGPLVAHSSVLAGVVPPCSAGVKTERPQRSYLRERSL